MERPSKDNYYLGIAKAVSKRGTCIRRRYGAVLVNEDEIRGTGYVGSPRGSKNCVDEGFCPRQKAGIPAGERYDECNGVHAEQNVIISVPRRDAIGGTLYVYGENLEKEEEYFQFEACRLCKRMIVNAGIKIVITGNKASDIKRYYVEDWLADGSIEIAAKK
ncbi:MAG: cytidine deaminase [bacterium]